MGAKGRLVPVHTPRLKDACRCGPCRQRTVWTPERRAAVSARQRGVKRPDRKRPSIACRWLPEHEHLLRELLGTVDTETIAACLTERFGWPRTEQAVRSRIKLLGLSRLTVRPWSKRELWRLLGLTEDRLDRYLALGMISGTPWKLGGGKRKGNRSVAFTRADVERFIRAHPACVVPSAIRDGGLRTLAESLMRGRPTLSIPEAARRIGMPYATLMYWCKTGRVPSAAQIDGRYWRVALDDVAALSARVAVAS
jgi:hypothetical protein